MKPEYEPKTREQILGYLIEEAGEVLAAAGKTLRWGDESRDPDEPTNCVTCDRYKGEHGPSEDVGACDRYVDPRETNREWILRELVDLDRAVGFVRRMYDKSRPAEGGGESA